MNPPSGVLFLPTQILNICGSAAVIAEVKEKFMKCLPPSQHIPVESREQFADALESLMELVNILDANLHKIYLLVDKPKLEQIIGVIVYSQVQMEMYLSPSDAEPEFIMTYNDVLQAKRILDDFITLFSSVAAWTASEEGTLHRRSINQAHAAMVASFDSWLSAAMPRDFMDFAFVDAHTKSASPASPPTASSSKRKTCRPPSLSDLSLRSASDIPPLSIQLEACAIMTPPPLSPLCRYRHAGPRSCKYCHGIPRKAQKLTSRSAPDTGNPDASSPRKRARRSHKSNNSATLVCSGSPGKDQMSLDSPDGDDESESRPPSVITVDSDNSSDDSGTSLLMNSERLMLRPLRRPQNRQCTPHVPQPSPPSQTSFWFRMLKDVLPFL